MIRTAVAVAQDPSPPLEWLLRQPCWGIAAGAGTGWQVSLHFGRKLRRARESANPCLSEDLRLYEGEVILFVQCPWSLQHKSRTLCSSDSDNRPGRAMLRGLNRLIGQTVEHITTSIPPMRLALAFSGDLTLHITSHSAEGDAGDNYTLFIPGMSYTIGPDLKLRREQRRPLEASCASPVPAGRKRAAKLAIRGGR